MLLKKVTWCCLFLFVFSFNVFAETNNTELIKQIDTLFENGLKENYKASGMTTLKQSLDLCLESKEKFADDYDILWRTARSAVEYAEVSKTLQIEGWKKNCRQYGKMGMNIAEEAQKIDPNRVEAYWWQVKSIGKYADGAGIVTAIKEGFYGKSKNSMGKAYEIEKSYCDYGPVHAHCMFYHTLPWPMKDKKKALKYYEEFAANTKWTFDPYIEYQITAEFLMTLKGEEYQKEARRLLEIAISDYPHYEYYHDRAKKLLKKMK